MAIWVINSPALRRCALHKSLAFLEQGSEGIEVCPEEVTTDYEVYLNPAQIDK